MATTSTASTEKYLVFLNDDDRHHLAGSGSGVGSSSMSSSIGVHAALENKFKIKTDVVYHHTIRGFSATLSAHQALRLATDPSVQAVIKDQKIKFDTVNSPRVVKSANSSTSLAVKTKLKLKLVSSTSSTSSSDSISTSSLVQNDQWGIKTINAPVVALADTRENIWVDADVYVLDSGVDHTHPDLNVVESVSTLSGKLETISLSTNTNGVTTSTTGTTDRLQPPLQGHGTHVAGIIAAKGGMRKIVNDTSTGADPNPSVGVGAIGVAPGARIHSVRVLDERAEGLLSWVFLGLDFIGRRNSELIANNNVMGNQPMLVNVSLGLQNSVPNVVTQIDVIIERLAKAGVIFVVAAGNHFQDVSYESPAHSPSVVTVGSHNFYGSFSFFSNYGKAVDILAPGEDIISTWPGGVYAMLSGTSQAAPHITGVIALYLSRWRQLQSSASSAVVSSSSASDIVTGDNTLLRRILDMLNTIKTLPVQKCPPNTTPLAALLPNDFAFAGGGQIKANIVSSNTSSRVAAFYIDATWD